MTQEEIKRTLRVSLIVDWNHASTHDRALIIVFCANDFDAHVPLSTMQNILPRLCEVKQMMQRDLEALQRNLETALHSTIDIDDLVRHLVCEVVNHRIGWLKMTDIDDYDSSELEMA